MIARLLHLIKGYFDLPARKGGILPQPVDTRDYQYEPSGAAVLTEIDFSNELPPIKNQGAHESCVAHSIITLLQDYMRRYDGITPTDINLSEAYTWYWHRVMEDRFPQNTGVFARDGFKALKRYGFVDHKHMPWTTHFAFHPSKAALAAGAVARDLWMPRFEYRTVSGADIKDAVLSRIPVFFAIGIDQDFLRVSRTNYVYDNKGLPVLFNHAMVLCGLKKIDGREFYKVRNSWGNRWGFEGHVYVPRFWVEGRAHSVWVLTPPAE